MSIDAVSEDLVSALVFAEVRREQRSFLEKAAQDRTYVHGQAQEEELRYQQTLVVDAYNAVREKIGDELAAAQLLGVLRGQPNEEAQAKVLDTYRIFFDSTNNPALAAALTQTHYARDMLFEFPQRAEEHLAEVRAQLY